MAEIVDTDPPSKVRPRIQGPVTETGEEERAYKKRRVFDSYCGNIVTLIVGTERKEFVVHKNVLCAASPFFESACKAEWMGDGGAIELLEDEPGLINVMAYWMHHNEIGLLGDLAQIEVLPIEGTNDVLAVLLKLFILGQKYQMPMMRNDVLDAILLLTVYCGFVGEISAEAFAYIWENTLDGSALRCLMLELISFYFSEEDLKEMQGQGGLSSEFWADVAVSFCSLYLKDEDDNVENVSSYWKEGKFCKNFHIHCSTTETDNTCSTRKPFLVFNDTGDKLYRG